jgi:hypothetical protein
MAQQILQEYLEGERQPSHVKSAIAQRVQTVIEIGLPIDGKRRKRVE